MKLFSSRSGCKMAAWPSSATGNLAGGTCGKRLSLAASDPSSANLQSLATLPGSLDTIPTHSCQMAGDWPRLFPYMQRLC